MARIYNVVCLVVNDPHFAYVTTLLHLNGADGSTTFTDVKGNTWAGVGNAQLDTADKKFGSASLLLDGTGDRIETPHSTNYAASGDFTVELWFKTTSPGTTQLLATKREAAGSDYQFAIVGGNVYIDVWNGAGILSLQGTTAVGTGWRHAAAVKSGTGWKLYLDGVEEAAGSETGAYLASASSALRIGGTSDFLWDFNGWIDDFRLTKGFARYTSNFTPPSTEFPDE